MRNASKTSRRGFLRRAGVVGLSAPLATAVGPGLAKSATGTRAYGDQAEPDIKAALGWWSELPNKWTAVGWRDHLFRFNVLFNGTLIAEPAVNRRTDKWKGQGLQISFAPSGARSWAGTWSPEADCWPQTTLGNIASSRTPSIPLAVISCLLTDSTCAGL